MDTQNFSKVSDHALVATLIYLGYLSRGTDKLPNDKRVSFLFENEDSLVQTMELFYNGEIRVDPKRFSQCMKEVKTRIHQFYPEYN